MVILIFLLLTLDEWAPMLHMRHRHMKNELLLKKRSRLRRRLQLSTFGIVIVTIVAGLKYPLIGFVVPTVMLIGIIGGFLNGRYVCGWICPRGGFYDRVMSRVSPKKRVPAWLRDYRFRWLVFVLLMGLMIFQILQDPRSLHHWGAVFVRICLVTTLIGVFLAFIFHPRTWCSFCPMGTIQSVLGPNKKVLVMGDGCLKCRACERVCPMSLQIVDNIECGRLDTKDCIKCPECQLACPKGILNFDD